MEDLAAVREGGGGVELDEEALEALRGKPAIYHCISRVVGREFVLGPTEREHFVKLMRLYEDFGHLQILTFCVMSNHFHILVEVPARPEEDPDDEELLAHLARLYSEPEMAEIRWELEHYRSQGNERGAEALRQGYLSRMWDLSSFMRILKQRFTQWFNPQHERRGTLWEERFKSVLVEDGHAARVVAAYIDLNPVRAGMVEDSKRYRWCGYGEAVAGKKAAREGLQRTMLEHRRMTVCEEVALQEALDWRKVVAKYRRILHEDGKVDGEAGAQLSEVELLRRRVRYFADGMMIGTKAFVDFAYRLSRDRFGANRRTGARKMRGVASELHTARVLRTGVQE
jgi:putative transposase